MRYKDTKNGRATSLISSYKKCDRLKGWLGLCDLDMKWVVDNILSKQCVYCGESDWRKIGCDRKDNSLPHTKDNCVPCCKDCNLDRGRLSYDEFMLVANYRKQKMLEKEFES